MASATGMYDIIHNYKEPPKDWKEKRARETGADKHPAGWVWIEDTYSNGKYSDWYNKDTIRKVITAAQRNNIPEHLLGGVIMAETQFGNTDNGSNLGHIFFDAHPDIRKDTLDPTKNPHMAALIQEAGTRKERMSSEEYDDREKDAKENFLLDHTSRMLNKELSKTSDLITALQNYSGRGKKPYGGRVGGAMFGKDVKDIDFAKDQDQGNRAAGLSNVLLNHPEFNKMIKETNQGATGLSMGLQL